MDKGGVLNTHTNAHTDTHKYTYTHIHICVCLCLFIVVVRGVVVRVIPLLCATLFLLFCVIVANLCARASHVCVGRIPGLG